jgi:hypothetical protein
MTLLIALASRISLLLLWLLPATQKLASQSTHNATTTTTTTTTRMCILVVARTTTQELTC